MTPVNRQRRRCWGPRASNHSSVASGARCARPRSWSRGRQLRWTPRSPSECEHAAQSANWVPRRSRGRGRRSHLHGEVRPTRGDCVPPSTCRCATRTTSRSSRATATRLLPRSSSTSSRDCSPTRATSRLSGPRTSTADHPVPSRPPRALGARDNRSVRVPHHRSRTVTALRVPRMPAVT